MKLQSINCPVDKIVAVRWHPTHAGHLAVLFEKKGFHIYNIREDLDHPVFSLETTGHQFCDFSFSQTKNIDLSDYAVFFMNSKGQFYYYCPILIEGTRADQSFIAQAERKIQQYQAEDTHEKERNYFEKIINYWKDPKGQAATLAELQSTHQPKIAGPFSEHNAQSEEAKYVRFIKLSHTTWHIFAMFDESYSVRVVITANDIIVSTQVYIIVSLVHVE